MADTTKIEWADATWSPITGCSVKSPGCTNCYAMKLAGTRMKNHWSRSGLTEMTKSGPVWNGQLRFNEQWLDQPLRWRKPRMIFVCAHGDLFHEDVPDEWIDRIFAIMALCPQHIFQILTKRADRMQAYVNNYSKLPDEIGGYYDLPTDGSVPLFQPLKNVWLGVSVEDQTRADERIPDLLETPAAVRWLSMEPLLSPVNLTQIGKVQHFGGNIDGTDALAGEIAESFDHGRLRVRKCNKIDWVVVGGESGRDARPMHPDWARSLRDQCDLADTPFFFKQWGEWAPHPSGQPVTIRQYQNSISYIDVTTGNRKKDPNRHTDETMRRIGKKKAGRLLDGQLHDAMPEGGAA